MKDVRSEDADSFVTLMNQIFCEFYDIIYLQGKLTPKNPWRGGGVNGMVTSKRLILDWALSSSPPFSRSLCVIKNTSCIMPRTCGYLATWKKVNKKPKMKETHRWRIQEFGVQGFFNEHRNFGSHSMLRRQHWIWKFFVHLKSLD